MFKRKSFVSFMKRISPGKTGVSILGKYFGYPKCCQKMMPLNIDCAKLPNADLRRHHGFLGTGFIPCKHHTAHPTSTIALVNRRRITTSRFKLFNQTQLLSKNRRTNAELKEWRFTRNLRG